MYSRKRLVATAVGTLLLAGGLLALLPYGRALANTSRTWLMGGMGGGMVAMHNQMVSTFGGDMAAMHNQMVSTFGGDMAAMHNQMVSAVGGDMAAMHNQMVAAAGGAMAAMHGQMGAACGPEMAAMHQAMAPLMAEMPEIHNQVVAALAATLEMTAGDLQQALEQGTTLATLAEEQGVAPEDLKAMMVSTMEQLLAGWVQAGRLEAGTAEQLQAALPQHAELCLTMDMRGMQAMWGMMGGAGE